MPRLMVSRARMQSDSDLQKVVEADQRLRPSGAELGSRFSPRFGDHFPFERFAIVLQNPLLSKLKRYFKNKDPTV